ncbi:uncharacterized protein LOC141702909 [Apium graveolens]|uniref:uncharacterized protein LOC141702909 n=1 Tax=Apium graveolens TaxID=4045 RepID=UPI003D7A536B
MEDEFHMIEKNKTWQLVERPKNKEVVGVNWIYRIMHKSDGSWLKNKARLVAKGYSQHKGVDYLETFIPVARNDTIRTVIALAAQKGWKLYELDVKSAFLNGDLEEKIYVDQPDGFVIKGQEGKVYKLKKCESTNLTNAQKEALKETRKKDANALFFIQQAISESLFPRIMRVATAKEAWEVLQEEFQGNSNVRSIKLQSLRRDFENLNMNESKNLKDYYSILNEIVNQMALYGEVVTDKKVVEKILISLTDKYDAMVSIIEETKDINTLKCGELMASLQSHEQRLMRHSEKSIESALQCKLNLNKKESPSQSYNGGVSSRGGMFNRGRGRGQRGRGKSNYNRCLGDASQTNKCEICKQSSHTEKDCCFKGKPQCHHCKKFGHLRKDCRFKNQQQVNVSEEKEDGYAVFYANCQVTNEKSSTTWLLDSGCSNHMTGGSTIFTKIDKSITPEVKMGNGILVQARGKVPDLDQNLLIVGQLIENGYAAYFEDGTCTIYDKNKGRKLVAKIQMKRGRSFQLMFNYDADLALKAHLKEESLLWHKRLGHIHSQGLKELKNMVYGLLQVEDNNEVFEGSKSKGYRLYSLKKKSIIIIRDMLFDEGASWNWEKEACQNQTITFEAEAQNEDKNNDQSSPASSPSDPSSPTDPSSPSSDSARSSSSGSTPLKMRSLGDIYESCNFCMTKPTSFEEAIRDDVWKKAMEDEFHMIEKNKTWQLVERPKNKEVVGVNWIYRIMHKSDAQKGWKLYELDVKLAFLNGDLEEKIYVDQPDGFVIKGQEGKVYKLKKALYGLKQAPRQWYTHIDNYFLENGFVKSKSEPTLYVKKQGMSILIVAIYVDDLIFTSNDEHMINQFKSDMMKKYEMSDTLK